MVPDAPDVHCQRQAVGLGIKSNNNNGNNKQQQQQWLLQHLSVPP
jgi:hypothetical protein